MKSWSVRPRDGTTRWSALAGWWADAQSRSASVADELCQGREHVEEQAPAGYDWAHIVPGDDPLSKVPLGGFDSTA
ncbi:hypothetical protein ACWC4E_30555 [Streptomyces sp. NPDC001273]|uniref:hypothetical protein n=1 Tax=Streptomyces sp. NPDC007056 TaxID=3155358 RepID=UPI0033FE1F13